MSDHSEANVILTPILRPILSSPLRGLFGPTLAPNGAILHRDASKNKPLMPVTYNGKYLVVKNV